MLIVIETQILRSQQPTEVSDLTRPDLTGPEVIDWTGDDVPMTDPIRYQAQTSRGAATETSFHFSQASHTPTTYSVDQVDQVSVLRLTVSFDNAYRKESYDRLTTHDRVQSSSQNIMSNGPEQGVLYFRNTIAPGSTSSIP